MIKNLNFDEMTAFLFGEKEYKKMKGEAADKMEQTKTEWEVEIAQIMNDLEENNDIIEMKGGNPMRHKILIDVEKRTTKPTNSQTGEIQKRIFNNPVEMTIEEIAHAQAIEGRTIKASYLTDSKKSSFISSSLIAIDIDNGHKVNGVKTKVSEDEYMTIDSFITSCKNNNMNPAVIYKTFSHDEEWHRFRAIFQLDRVITSVAEMDMIYNAIQKIYPQADRAVKSVALIHGGQGLVLVNKDAVIKAKDYIPTNISAATIADLDNKVANIREVKRTTKGNVKISKDEIITNALMNTYGNKTFESYEELKQYLLSINLADLLRVNNPSKFNCIFHVDNKPSAGIIEINGEYLYNCLGGCEKGKKDIFNIISYLKGYQGSEAEKFVKAQAYLMKELNIKVQDQEWMEAQFKAFRCNRLMIIQNKINKNTYPALAPRMRFISNLLRAMLDHAEASVMSYPSKDYKGQALFFVSYTQLAELLGKDKDNTRTIRTQVAELAMIGLIRKVSDEEVQRVASKRFKMSLKYKIDHNQVHTVQYYSIPMWTTQLLLDSDKIKAQSNKVGVTTKGMTQRAASTINKDSYNKVSYEESEYTKKNIDQLITWSKRTIARKGAILKDDFMNYAKKQKIGSRYAASILPIVITQLKLNKITLKNEDIKKYSFSKKSLRKTAFIK